MRRSARRCVRQLCAAAGLLLGLAAEAPRAEAPARRQLIMGGEEDLGPHAFVVSLQHRNRHFCGGTLLDEWHVLTAAHCEQAVRCTGEICEGLDVNVYRRNVSKLAEEEFPGCSAVLRGAAWVSNPLYSGSPAHLHDIAIIRLRDRVPDISLCSRYGLGRNSVARVDLLELPLQQSGVRSGSAVQAVGWGRVWPDGPLSPDLLDTPMRAMLTAECRRAWSATLGSQQICAASGSGGEVRDVCNGDSGGPLIMPDTNVQVGIVSYSHKCGTPGVPSVFTDPRTPQHMAFIQSTIRCLDNPRCCPYQSASDGVVASSEECDDGNNIAGDGCFCGRLEDGYFCHGSPSQCMLCGDVPLAPPARLPRGMRVCSDADAGCSGWAQRGECSSNPGYMNVRCPVSCAAPACWVDTRPQPQPAFLTINVEGALQSDVDWSWQLIQRFSNGHDPFVRNTGMGSGFLICQLPDDLEAPGTVPVYELHMNSDRWNTSLGFDISTGGQMTVQVPAWTGATTSVAFDMQGTLADGLLGTLEADSCVNIQFHDGSGSPPSILANSPAVFGPSEFQLGLTEFVLGQPAKACGDRLENSAAVRGKIVVLDRGDCYFVHKAVIAQQAGAIGLIIVNYDDNANRGLTVNMGAASDAGRPSDNPCCVDIPLAMITAESGRMLRQTPQMQISMRAAECYIAPNDCPVAWIGLIKPGCGACRSGEVLDCNEVCRPAELLANGECDIGKEISGSTDFSCREHQYDHGDCPAVDCEDDPVWRDPLGRACSDEQYQAVPGVCGEFEESLVQCQKSCHTCEGACNSLWSTVADQGVATSCAKVSFVFGVSCDDVEAVGIDCSHARFCGYCGREREDCARGWQRDCDGVCSPIAWVGDGECDSGIGSNTAFNLNCKSSGWWDGGDCGQHTLPLGCSTDGSALRTLGAGVSMQTVNLAGGYGDNWDCRYQISCPTGGGVWVAFDRFETEDAFDRLDIFIDIPAADLQLERCGAACQQQCSSLRDSRPECQVWAVVPGGCESNPGYMLTQCAYSCAGCTDAPVSSPASSWSGGTLPQTQFSPAGVLTLRFTSDSAMQADGLAFEYACGRPPADISPCASNPCENGTCQETVSNSVRGFWCQCQFGFDGFTCHNSLSAAAVAPPGSCEQQMVSLADDVSRRCCGRGLVCTDGVPTVCSASCATSWLPFTRACGQFLALNLPQFNEFTAVCEDAEYGDRKSRCPPTYWNAGVTAVLNACCPRGDRACSDDITRLPHQCPVAGPCAVDLEQFFAVCHGMAEQRQPEAHAAMTTLLTSCQG